MRKSGILMHISSLPSKYGIGSLGEEAVRFIDFLAASGQTYWQTLPLNQTGYGDSPYQSFSTFAGNPYFIDLDILADEGLLEEADYRHVNWNENPSYVDYGIMYENRYRILRKAASRFSSEDPSFDDFCVKNEFWLEDYALFMALKDANSGAPLISWERSLRVRNEAALDEARKKYEEDIRFWKIVQYLFYKQWNEVRRYANEKGIKLFGDLPIYISPDSADVWAHPEQFQLDEDRMPTEVAGVPPDYFSEDGQLWGNPLFNWERMSEDGYSWWISRLEFLCNVFDVVRLDHFIGFDRYYAVPYGDTTARRGRWRNGPGFRFFEALEKSIGRKQLIAENLGVVTESTIELLDACGFPGMAVLEFAFSSGDFTGGSEFIPHNYDERTIAYVGTHDNDTALGWAAAAKPEELKAAVDYLGLNHEEGYSWGMMRGLWMSNAAITIVQAQDLLGLGSEARMNTPSTTSGNWRWRALPGSFSPELAAKLKHCMEMYER